MAGKSAKRATPDPVPETKGDAIEEGEEEVDEEPRDRNDGDEEPEEDEDMDVDADGVDLTQGIWLPVQNT